MEHRLQAPEGRPHGCLWIISESQGSRLRYFKFTNDLAGCSVLWILDAAKQLVGLNLTSTLACALGNNADSAVMMALFGPKIFHLFSKNQTEEPVEVVV